MIDLIEAKVEEYVDDEQYQDRKDRQEEDRANLRLIARNYDKVVAYLEDPRR